MTNTKRTLKNDNAVKSNRSKKPHLASVVPNTPVAPVQDLASSPLGNGPIHKEQLGRLHLAIWARQDKNGTVRFSVKLSRNYKTENGFRETSSLDQSDLLNAIALLTTAQNLLPPADLVLPQI